MYGEVQVYSETFANKGSRLHFLFYFSGGRSPGADAGILRTKSIAGAAIYFAMIAASAQPPWALASWVTRKPTENKDHASA